MITLRDQLLRQLFLDLFPELLLDHRSRRFARTVTRNSGITRIVARDRIPLLAHVFGRQLNAERRDTVRLIFDFDLHGRSDGSGAPPEAQTAGPLTRENALASDVNAVR